eukprot:1138167-Pelagomonas_calceolata.AAC.1
MSMLSSSQRALKEDPNQPKQFETSKDQSKAIRLSNTEREAQKGNRKYPKTGWMHATEESKGKTADQHRP